MRIPVLALAVVFFLAASATSLPMFRNLFQARAGYKASCAACHQVSDGRLTSYGREYLRLGRGEGALAALDLMDPDQDGVPSGEEIKRRANPGDPRSTPRHIGDWLADLHPAAAPEKLLAEVFGPYVRSQVVEKKLSSSQMGEAERSIGQKLSDEDAYAVVFRARGAGAGRAGYAYFEDERGVSVFLVVLGPEPVIKAVKPVRVRGDQRLAGEAYLGQFRGKTYSTLRAVAAPRGAEAKNESMLEAVRRAMKIIETAVP